ncbi:MAG TPA: AraC family transcriptional regulator [Candidatus Methylacidiphilales bacterium]
MHRIRFADLGVAPFEPYVAVTRLAPGETTLRHRHDFHEFFLVLEGSALHHLNRRRDPIRTGDLCVLEPDDAHHYTTGPGESIAFVNVAVGAPWWRHFHSLFAGALPPLWHRSRGPSSLRSLPPSAVRRVEAALERVREASSPGGPALALGSAALFVDIAACFAGPEGEDREPPPEWLEAWRRELLRAGPEVAEPIGVWQRRGGRSPEHLARSCRKFYGATPTDLLNAARIARAKDLLRLSDRKVIDIALECGFSNLANFYRHFARFAGTVPTVWRAGASAAVPRGVVRKDP